jgi:hypothetical protein
MERKYHSTCVRLIAGAALFLFIAPVSAQKAAVISPGESQLTPHQRVEYLIGNLPIIISAPHGGRLSPKSIPNRPYGTLPTDGHTQILAKGIAQEFFNQTRKFPHVVICHLIRLKVDCNRPIEVAAQGNEDAQQVWRDYHHFIGDARDSVVKTNGRGIYIDLHGHAHPNARLELGYLLNHRKLQLNDEDIAVTKRISSFRFLQSKAEVSFADMLRGKTSFGWLMQKRGFPAIPSPQYPSPTGEKFFSGGYNTRHYSLDQDGKLFGFQLECPKRSVRDTEENRKGFATAFVGAMMEYLEIHMGFRIESDTPSQ